MLSREGERANGGVVVCSDIPTAHVRGGVQLVVSVFTFFILVSSWSKQREC